MASTSNLTISRFQCPLSFDFNPTNISHFPEWFVPAWSSLGAINIITAPLIVLINFLVIWTVLENEHLRSQCYYLVVVVLSISDLLVGLVVQPMLLALGFSVILECSCVCEIYMVFLIPTFLCHSWTAVSMVIISLERYLFIEHPLYYQTTVTSKKLMSITAVSWVVVGAVVLVSRLLDDSFSARQLPLILTLGPSFVITLFCVSKINLTARRQMRAITAQQQFVAAQQRKIKEYKRTFTLGLIVLASVVCLCPILILRIIGAVRGNEGGDFKYISQSIYATSLNLQSLINPIIYSIRLSDIRAGVIKKLRCSRAQ